MVELMQDMPPGMLGFRVNGRITSEDYADVLVPELNRAIDGGGGVRAMYVIEDLDAIEPSALWADTKLGFDLVVRHHDAFERNAIVTDIDWMARATQAFGWMIPGEARVFPLTELEQAKAWVAGG